MCVRETHRQGCMCIRGCVCVWVGGGGGGVCVCVCVYIFVHAYVCVYLSPEKTNNTQQST